MDDMATAERAKCWPDVEENIEGIIGGRVLGNGDPGRRAAGSQVRFDAVRGGVR
jgi:hypothetical protein